MKKNIILATIFLETALVASGCAASDITDILNTEIGSNSTESSENSIADSDIVKDSGSSDQDKDAAPSGELSKNKSDSNMSGSTGSASSSTLLDTSDMFSSRDLEQEADLTDATYIALTSGEDVTITSEGVYVISGTAADTTIVVEATDAKVQLVLDGVTITNSDSPAIYVKEADKVFVTTTDSTNTLSVTGKFTADGDTNTDAVIFSKDDLVLNGVGTLNITSKDNGISGKDDLKITGGTYNITADSDAVEANDSIRIYDGDFTILCGKDAFHSENDDDNTLGYIYIQGGTFEIDATDDGVQATTVLVIDDGTFNIDASEGLEATYIQINGGDITINASDDGINAAQKSTAYDVVIEINGGTLNITMGSGDTDGLDANGYLYINGGTITITANSPFDYDRGAELNGGTVIVNGEEVTELTNSMMGGGFGNGGMRGGFGGQQGNWGNQQSQGTDGTQNSGQAPGGTAPSDNSGQSGFGGGMQGGGMQGGGRGH